MKQPLNIQTDLLHFVVSQDNIVYVDIYSKLLHTSTASAPLAPENKQLKDKVEWERGFEELRALREVCIYVNKQNR